jgi:hypothetical protein
LRIKAEYILFYLNITIVYGASISLNEVIGQQFDNNPDYSGQEKALEG